MPLAVLPLVAAAGFLVGAWVEPFASDPVPPRSPLPIDLGAEGRYFALGDSYSAGEGLEPFEGLTRDIDEGGDRCHRSEEFAYSRRLEFVWETTTVFHACSGANVENIFDVVQEHSGVPDNDGLQVDADDLGPDDVRLVTLTIGGNDVDFAKVLTFCLKNDHCTDDPYKNSDSLRDWVETRLSTLRAELLALYGRLRESFPTARILVLGYPALFPERAPSWLRLDNADCTLLFRVWTTSEREAIRDWGFRLDEIVHSAADEVGIEYVDILPHFTGHEPCTLDEWVRFVGVSANSAIRDSSFHPLRDGQAMMARIVACHLRVFDDADTPRTETTEFAMTGCVAQETTHVVEPPQATPTPT